MNCPTKCCVFVVLGAFFASPCVSLRGDTAWINPLSGSWQEPANWSFGVPHVDQPVTHIALGGESKTITIDATTPGTNLVIQRLNISGPGITNTLLLSAAVLEVRSTLEMRAGSELHLVESTLRLPSSDSSFDVNAGEVWLESGSIEAGAVNTRIGRDGGVAVMRLENGTAQLNEVLLGRRVSRSGAQGTLLLSGGRLEIDGKLDVGADPGCVGQIVVTGGEMIAAITNLSAAIGEQGDGALMISNGVVRLEEVDVGRHTNVIGTLHATGGSTWIEDLSLARFPLSTGMVFQAGGQFVVNDLIRVGHEGRGEMTISGGNVVARSILVADATNTASGLLVVEGGMTLLRSNLTIGTAVSTGEVVMAGGMLVIVNQASSGTLAPVQGRANLTGGSVIVDRLELPAAAGSLDFSHGYLSSASTVVSNGLPFVVGDGTNVATFHLRGGTHYFHDGLVISSNAILTGCGTIIGNVNNEGSIATNCNPAAPLLLNPAHANNAFSFSFDSQAGSAYMVECADTLDGAPWIPLLRTNGTGTPVTITDSPPAPARRFYRVRVD